MERYQTQIRECRIDQADDLISVSQKCRKYCHRFKNFKLFGFPVDMNTLFPFPKHKEISVIKRLFICHHFFDDKFVTSFAEQNVIVFRHGGGHSARGGV
jgi:hypothetical protein